MLNSMIMNSIIGFVKGLGKMFEHTWIYSLIMRIYTAFSKSWKNSAIMTFFKGNSQEEISQKSVIWKIFRLPFVFLEWIGKKIGDRLNYAVVHSRFCTWGRCYIQNFMAINSRFFGIMMLTAGLSAFLVKFAVDGYMMKVLLAVAAVGAVLTMFNCNFMAFLNPSWVVKFVKCCAGFREIDFEFFDEIKTNGIARLVLAALVGIVTGVAMMTVSPMIGILIPFALFGMLAVLWKPIIGVYAAVVVAPIVPTMLLAGVCIWTAMSLVIYSWLHDGFKWKIDGVGVGIILLLAVLFVSSALSFAMLGSLKVWSMYLVFAGFYIVIINTVETKEALYALLRLFVISGALVALYGVCQYVFGWTTANAWIDETMFEDETMRVYSTLGNPNVLGEFLLLVIPVSAVFMIKDAWKHSSKYVYAGMFLLAFLCLILTQSRGCWIGFMLAAVIFVTFCEGRLWSLLPLVILLLPLVIPDTIVDRIMSVGNMEDSSTSYRVYIWLATLGMLKTYWLGGIGMGEAAFNEVYPFYSYNAIVAPHSHNTFLQLTVEAGVGALIVFVVTQIVFVKKMQSVYAMNDKKSLDSVTALAIGSGVVGFLAQSMFDYTFYNYRVMCIFFMVMALGTALKYVVKDGGDN